MSLEDTFQIEKLIAVFSNSFDVKDWDGLQACLTASLFTDYGDLRGTPPETVSASDYVRARRESLQNIFTQHLSGNYEITFDDMLNATCRVSMVIWRKSENEYFTSHCVYTFKVAKIRYDWKICGITQKIIWNEGASSIHPGTKP
jgi:hypothetical protein